MKSLDNNEAHACLLERHRLSNGRCAALDACAEGCGVEAIGVVPTLLQPFLVVFCIEHNSDLVAHSAFHWSPGFVERVGVDAFCWDAVGVDAFVYPFCDGMPACAWLGADEAQTYAFGEDESLLRLGGELKFDFEL